MSDFAELVAAVDAVREEMVCDFRAGLAGPDVECDGDGIGAVLLSAPAERCANGHIGEHRVVTEPLVMCLGCHHTVVTDPHVYGCAGCGEKLSGAAFLQHIGMTSTPVGL